MGKFSRTVPLMKASWEVLKKDREMIVFPVLAAIGWFMFILAVVLPFAVWNPGGIPDEQDFLFYLFLFLFLFCTYFVMTFANACLTACAAKRMAGGDPTVGDGFKAAFSRIHSIIGWSLLGATLGILLKALENRLKGFGKLIADIIGVSFGVASYLVVPIMVVENKGPLAALKESAHLFKQTWGEQFIGDFSFALAYIGSVVLGILLLVPAFIIGDPRVSAVFLLIVGLLVLGLWVVTAVLQAIFQSALYRYAKDRNSGVGFSDELLEKCFVSPQGKFQVT